MGCLYLIESPSGKRYIGITQNELNARIYHHRKSKRKSSLVTKSIAKYGLENMTIKALLISNDRKYLELMEMRAIKSFKTKAPNGYNLTDGGEGVVNIPKESEEIRISKIKKAWATPEIREKYKQRDIEWSRKHPRKPDKIMKYKRGSKEHSEHIRMVVNRMWADPEKAKNLKAKVTAHLKSSINREKASKKTSEIMSNPIERLKISRTLSKYSGKTFIKTTGNNPFKPNAGNNGNSYQSWNGLPYRFNYDYLWMAGFRNREIDKMINRGAIMELSHENS